MTLHLAEISKTAKPQAHGLIPLDQAGWYGSKDLEIAENITLLPLPSRSPELEPGREYLAVHPN